MNHEFDNLLREVKRLHFVGIGGAGMCPLAEILHGKGYEITGSDMNEGDNIDRLRSLGITVYMGHRAENVVGAQALIHTAAVHADNPELIYAKENNIPVIERSILLGIISRTFENTIAVCGTHGKTTTTSMISHVMYLAKVDPTIIIGGRLPVIQSNGRSGKSETMVCEACEYVDTFLQIEPNVSLILNIDEDHLDYFKTLDNIIRSFNKFANQTKSTVVVNGDDANSMKSVQGVDKKIITYGMGEANDYHAKNITAVNGSYFRYDLYYRDEKLGHIELGVPGEHNIVNSLGAAAVLLDCGVSISDIEKHIPTFSGAGRRFEIYGCYNGVTLIDDFAHHPHEIDATIKAAKSLVKGDLWVVFQPYTYSRTSILLGDFIKSLSKADKTVLTEIKAAREENIWNVHTSDITDKLSNTIIIDDFDEIADYIVKNAKPDDYVITMGGGDIYKAARKIKEKYLSMEEK